MLPKSTKVLRTNKPTHIVELDCRTSLLHEAKKVYMYACVRKGRLVAWGATEYPLRRSRVASNYTASNLPELEGMEVLSAKIFLR